VTGISYVQYILRRKCLLKDVIKGQMEGKLEVRGRRGRRSKQLLVDLRETERSWKLKEKTLDCLGGELALQDVMDLSSDWLLN